MSIFVFFVSAGVNFRVPFPVSILNLNVSTYFKEQLLFLKMCSWNWEKLKIVRNEFKLDIKKQDFSTSISETGEHVFISWLVSFGICIRIQYSLMW